MDAELRLDHSLVALETDDAVFGLLELRAPEPPVDADRPELAISLVIDRSGSMAGEKLAVAKACAGYLAGRITKHDSLAVVAYDDQVSLVAALQGPGPEVAFALHQIGPGGSTNLSGGWLKGVELLEGDPADVRRVLLLTDGLANVGITDSDQLAAMSASAAGRGISTTTIGFGEGFDEELLSAMADAGNGHDHFAASPDEAPSIFAQEFEGLATLVAQNLSVEVRPVGPAVNAAVLNEYPITSTGTGLQAALGDVFGGQLRKLVFRLQVPAMGSLGQVKVAEVVIRWADITAKQVKMHTRTVPITVNVVPRAEASSQPTDAEISEEVIILGAAQARKEARELADCGEYDRARELLAEQAERLRTIPHASDMFAAATEDLEQLERFERHLMVGTYDRLMSKEMWDQSRRRQRSQPYRKRPDRP